MREGCRVQNPPFLVYHNDERCPALLSLLFPPLDGQDLDCATTTRIGIFNANTIRVLDPNSYFVFDSFKIEAS